MTTGTRTVRLAVCADPGADTDEIAELVERLRAEVAELDVDVFPVPAGELPPPGAKAVDPTSASSLLVMLATSGGVLTSLVGLLQAWLLRNRARGLVVEIAGDRLEITDATPDERARLIAAWLSRHETAADETGGDVQ
jgi:hypothetical protein